MIKAKMKKIAASAIAVTSILMAAPINVYAEWKELENNHYGYIVIRRINLTLKNHFKIS